MERNAGANGVFSFRKPQGSYGSFSVNLPRESTLHKGHKRARLITALLLSKIGNFINLISLNRLPSIRDYEFMGDNTTTGKTGRLMRNKSIILFKEETTLSEFK